METRTPCPAYDVLASDVIATEPKLSHLKDCAVRIAYLSSDKEKTSHGREVLAECERVPDKYRWAIPYDFTVTVFEPNAERLNEDQMRVLMLHELMHIGVEVDGNEETYRIIPHDVEDFRLILDRYGLDWSK